MNLLIFLLAVLLFGGAFSAIYLVLVRPALLFWTRRTAQAILDDLRLAVMSGDIGDHEKAVMPTAEKLKMMTSGCEHVGIASVMITLCGDRMIKYEAERDAQMGKDAGATMKDIIRRADMLVVASLVLNSSFFWMFLPLVYAVGTVTGKMSKWVNSVSLAGKGGSHGNHHGGLAPA